MSFEKYFKDIGIATARLSIEMGVAHRRKSINVSLALIATSTPTGLPTTVALLPIFVANTIIITNGMGFTFRRAVKCSTVAVMKSMDVTSSTSAANIPDISIRIIISFFGLLPTLFRIFSSRCSKKCLQYGILVNILLGGFNLIPAFPLDVGRILRSALVRWKRDYDQSTKIAAKIGIAISYGFMGFGFISMLFGSSIGGIWCCL
jgi:Zn-dependent protease